MSKPLHVFVLNFTPVKYLSHLLYIAGYVIGVHRNLVFSASVIAASMKPCIRLSYDQRQVFVSPVFRGFLSKLYPWLCFTVSKI